METMKAANSDCDDTIGDAERGRHGYGGSSDGGSYSVDDSGIYQVDDFEDGSAFLQNRGGKRARSTAAFQKQSQEKKELLANKENRQVFVSRLIVLGVLVLSALGVSLTVYYHLRGSEHTQFVQQYQSDATKVLESFGVGLDHTFGSADAFAVKLVAYARSSNSSFPYVTMGDFYIQATKLLQLSGAFRVGLAMLVEDPERDEWEAYADANGEDWIETSFNLQEVDPDFHGERPINRNYANKYKIHDYRGQPAEGPKWCFPNKQTMDDTAQMTCHYSVEWQHTPVMSDPVVAPYNLDRFGIPGLTDVTMEAYKQRKAIISGFGHVWENTDDPAMAGRIKSALSGIKSYLPSSEDPSEPLSMFGYPIIPVMQSVRIDVGDGSDHGASADSLPPVAGMLSLGVRWVGLLREILPSRSRGIVVVFHQADCGPSFTYELNGPHAKYRGVGDLHEDIYDRGDAMVFSANLADLMGNSSNSGSSSTSRYTGLPLLHDYCAKTISVYPSRSMQESFETCYPAIMAFTAALIFLFTSAVFVMYDLLVARRQRTLLRKAIASGSIVSSLFPAHVKKQLYQEQEDQQASEVRQSKFLAPAVTERRRSNESNGRSRDCDNSQGAGSLVTSNRPIAEYYQSTTVLLADLAGFTKWSSTRTPVQVFELLETLYAAFDTVALHRNVFKIETIGDCYVAVTGLPKAQKDHAVRMARFANSCLHEMNRITTSLADKLGADTEELGLRIGLNSGGITAGVLRGDKARYQLFGDTINTASRIETNGEAGRIHISESTAREIEALGKAHWLVPRQDKIVAKGKGEMQTYWVTVFAGEASAATMNNARTSTYSATSVDVEADGDDRKSVVIDDTIPRNVGEALGVVHMHASASTAGISRSQRAKFELAEQAC